MGPVVCGKDNFRKISKKSINTYSGGKNDRTLCFFAISRVIFIVAQPNFIHIYMIIRYIIVPNFMQI